MIDRLRTSAPVTRLRGSIAETEQTRAKPIGSNDRNGRRDRPRNIFAGVYLVWAVLALFVAVYTLLPTLTNYARSLLVLQNGYAAAERDRSRVDAGIRSEVPATVTLVWRERDGSVYRGVVDSARFAETINAVLLELERGRREALSRGNAHIARDIQPTFAAMRARGGDFADWYFGWMTGYALAGRAIGSAASHLIETRATTLLEAVEHDLAGYVQHRYRDLVLMPEVSEPAIERAFDAGLLRAQEGYLRALARQEQRLQAFLHSETTHLERIDPAARVNVALDWRAQAAKMRAADPVSRTLAVSRGGILVTVGAVSGAPIGAAVARIVRPFLHRSAVMAGNVAAGGFSGGTAGTAAAPGIGTIAGALIGGAIGLAADVGTAEIEEALERGDFEKNLQAALDATEAEVTAKLTAGLEDAVNAWFGDASQLVAQLPR